MSVPAHVPPEQRYAAADAAHAAQLAHMDETQKMLAGLPYDPADAALVKARLRVRRIFRAFNLSETPADDAVGMGEERRRLFAELLGVQESEMAPNVFVEPPFWCDYGTNIHLEGNFYCNFNTTILDCAEVRIGDGVLFGPNVHLYGGTHTTAVPERVAGLERALPIIIGRDSWIGGNVSIMAGVTIGRGCTIGAGSTVTKNIPDWSVAIGTPAKVVRTLREEERGVAPAAGAAAA